MSTRPALSIAGNVAMELLKRISAGSVELFPPLKSLADSAIYIVEIIVNPGTTNKDWTSFCEYVQKVTASVITHADISQPDIEVKLRGLETVLKDVITRTESYQPQPRIRRIFPKRLAMISEMRQELDDILSLFKFSATITSQIEAGKIYEAVVNNSNMLSRIAQDTANIAVATNYIGTKTTSIAREANLGTLNATLGRLQYTNGASWDLHRVCLPNTRIKLLNDITTWVDGVAGESNQRVLLLTALAGAGKSTIAHTIAQHYTKNGQLLSSFFFDRANDARNNPGTLFSTLATDLSRVSAQLAERIAVSIEDDRSLPFAPISRQFEKLFLEPSQQCPPQAPLVIVIDGLDEGSNSDLLEILCNRVSELPVAFRIFLTSRMQPELEVLRQQAHVRSMTLNIHDSDNLADIGIFISYKLKQVARHVDLGDQWPGEQPRERFTALAEGHFLWVATVCNFLRTRANPTKELERLVSGSAISGVSAEEKLDRLYATILSSCDWTDEDFVMQYDQLMGAAIVAKIPLTVSALSTLHGDEPVASSLVLRQLSPLLSGLSKEEHRTQPVHFVHHSLRDFLTVRASNTEEWRHFKVEEKQHIQSFAFMCLRVLNRQLNGDTPGVGYLLQDTQGAPTITKSELPEVLSYACEFCIDHILGVGPCAAAVVAEALELFMATKVELWMELMPAMVKFRRLSQLRTWFQNAFHLDYTSKPGWDSVGHASTSLSLSYRLSYDNRLEEAQLAALEAAELYRPLPATYAPNLAASLCHLSHCFASLGHRHEALGAAQEAVAIRRQLANERPAALKYNLATALCGLSWRLYMLGRPEEGLVPAREALEICRPLAANYPDLLASYLSSSLMNQPYISKSLTCRTACLSDLGRCAEALPLNKKILEIVRQLAEGHPDDFTPCLAAHLNNISEHFLHLGQHEEALAASQESVEICRKLANENPAAYNYKLATALNDLSTSLTRLGRSQQEALEALQEAVEIRRQLAKKRPGTFAHHLALSLSKFSSRLLERSRHQEALEAMQEAVELYRQLIREYSASLGLRLTSALEHILDRFSTLGDRENLLATAQEVVELHRQLEIGPPVAFPTYFIDSLNEISNFLAYLAFPEGTEQ